MANTITLDSIRAAAEAKYGSTDITLSDDRVCRLLNPLRLTKERRNALMDVQKKLDVEEGEDASEVDQEALLGEAILLVAEKETLGKALLKEIGGDLAVLAQVFETYSKDTQAGEASASRD